MPTSNKIVVCVRDTFLTLPANYKYTKIVKFLDNLNNFTKKYPNNYVLILGRYKNDIVYSIEGEQERIVTYVENISYPVVGYNGSPQENLAPGFVAANTLHNQLMEIAQKHLNATHIISADIDESFECSDLVIPDSFGMSLLSDKSFIVHVDHMNVFGNGIPERLNISNNAHVWWAANVYNNCGKLYGIIPQSLGGLENTEVNEAKRLVLSGKRMYDNHIKPIGGKKVISYCLWGDDPKYTHGAISNVIIAHRLFPGWICRFYIGQSTPRDIVEKLKNMQDVEVIEMPTDGNWVGMVWRFLAACDPTVDVMISRDTDSRLGLREKEAIDEWLKSKRMFHIIRDHPQQQFAILGGMWGVKKGAFDMEWFKNVIASPEGKYNGWNVDQDMLVKHLYPVIVDKALIHDEIGAFAIPNESSLRIFPSRRYYNEIVQEVIPVSTEGNKIFNEAKAIQRFEYKYPQTDIEMARWRIENGNLRLAVQYFKRAMKFDKSLSYECMKEIMRIYRHINYPDKKSKTVFGKYLRRVFMLDVLNWESHWNVYKENSFDDDTVMWYKKQLSKIFGAPMINDK